MRNGTLYRLLVMANNREENVIGYGYVIVDTNGDMSQPDLFDLMGDRLPEGLYSILVTKDRFTVVIPERIQ